MEMIGQPWVVDRSSHPPLPRGKRDCRVAQHRRWQTGKQPSNKPINADLPNRCESTKWSVCLSLVRSMSRVRQAGYGQAVGQLYQSCCSGKAILVSRVETFVVVMSAET